MSTFDVLEATGDDCSCGHTIDDHRLISHPIVLGACHYCLCDAFCPAGLEGWDDPVRGGLVTRFKVDCAACGPVELATNDLLAGLGAYFFRCPRCRNSNARPAAPATLGGRQ